MRLINQAELAVVSGGDTESGNIKTEFSNPSDSILLDASATHSRGQNSWGESVPGGVDFYYRVVAEAALSAANYEQCMRENSKPSIGVYFASGITALGAGLAAGIFSLNPATGVSASTATFGLVNSLGVKGQQSNCHYY